MTRILAALLIAMPTAVSAHDWYPLSCCRGSSVGGDCRPVPAEMVTATATGWRYEPSGEIVGYSDPRIKQTPPEAPEPYHVCTLGGRETSRILCLFIPSQGS